MLEVARVADEEAAEELEEAADEDEAREDEEATEEEEAAVDEAAPPAAAVPELLVEAAAFRHEVEEPAITTRGKA